MTSKISIIIPLYILSDRFKKDFKRYLDLDYPDYEIMVVHDKGLEFHYEGVRVLNTGKDTTGPAEKRDLAIKEAQGSICAFIDDDAYPDRDWLKNAVKYFNDDRVGAVGGPGLTPPEDSFMMKAGGLCYESFMGSGPIRYRFVKDKHRTVDDITAYNLFIRKDVLEKTGGFASTFYGGEDTKLCIEITKLGKLILYRPDVIVYHHRRPLFMPHLLQIGNLGLHRGYFAKRIPQTSRKYFYFIPPLFVTFIFAGLILSMLSKTAAVIFGITVLLSLTSVFIDCFYCTGNALMSFLASLGIFLMHIFYGLQYFRGLMKGELEK